MLGFGYMLLVMLIIATISIAETSRTYEGIVPELAVGQEALDMISEWPNLRNTGLTPTPLLASSSWIDGLF